MSLRVQRLKSQRRTRLRHYRTERLSEKGIVVSSLDADQGIKTPMQMVSKKQTIAEGAIVLTLSLFLVKIVSVIYKFPLMNMLSGGGWGLYSSAYNVYGAIYSVAVTGFPTAVARMVATAYGERRYGDCQRIKEVAVKIFAIIGVVGSLGLLLSAKYVTRSNPNCCLSVMVVAPSILFSCLLSAYRGYYQGMSTMMPSAISDVIEVLVKAIVGLTAVMLINRGLAYEYNTYGTVLGVVRQADEVQASIMSVSSAGAMLAVTLSTGVSWVYFRETYKKEKVVTEAQMLSAPASADKKELTKTIFLYAFPLALSAITFRSASLIDNATVISNLDKIIKNSYGVLCQSLGRETIEEITAMFGANRDVLANGLYEIYCYGTPFFDLVPTIAAVFGASALPHIAVAYGKKDQEMVEKNLRATIKTTMFIAAPAGLGMAFMAEPIFCLTNPELTPKVRELAASMLMILGVASLFSSLTSSLNTMLQAVGHQNAPVVVMGIGSITKILVNAVLISMPSLNIKAAPAGNLCCFVLTTVLNMILLCHYTGMKIDYLNAFIKPIAGGAVSGFTARLIYKTLEPVFGTRIPALLGILAAVIVYAAEVILFRFLTKEEMKEIPGLKRMVPKLEKLNLIK